MRKAHLAIGTGIGGLLAGYVAGWFAKSAYSERRQVSAPTGAVSGWKHYQQSASSPVGSRTMIPTFPTTYIHQMQQASQNTVITPDSGGAYDARAT